MTFYLNQKKFFDDVSAPVFDRFDSAMAEHTSSVSDHFTHALTEFIENSFSKSCGGLYWIIASVSIMLFLDQVAFVLLFNIPAVKQEWFSGLNWADLISLLITFLFALFYANMFAQKDIESYEPGREYVRLASAVQDICTDYFAHILNILTYYRDVQLTDENIANIEYIHDELENFLFVAQLLNRKLLQMFVKQDNHLEYEFGITRDEIEHFHNFIATMPHVDILNISDHVEVLRGAMMMSLYNLQAIYSDRVEGARIQASLANIEDNFFEFQQRLRNSLAAHFVPAPSSMNVIRWILIGFFILVVIPFAGYQNLGLWTLIAGTAFAIVLSYPLIVVSMVSAPFQQHSHYKQANYFGLRTKIYQNNYFNYLEAERILGELLSQTSFIDIIHMDK